MRGPPQLTLGPHAAQQLAAVVKHVERYPRTKRTLRRRSPVRSGAAVPDVRKVTFVLPEALTNQAYVSGCPIVNDWYSNAGETEITVYNEAGWQGDAGAEGYAEYRPSDQTWPITLLPCPQGSS